MNKALALATTLTCAALLAPQFCHARGFGGCRGGSYHGGGDYHGGSGGYSGSHEGSYSGSHYSGSHEGGFSNGSYSGSRQGSFNGPNYSGSHEGSYSGNRDGGSFSGSRDGSFGGANFSGSHEGAYSSAGVGGDRYGAAGYGGAHYGAYGAAGYHGGATFGAAGYRGGYGAAGIGAAGVGGYAVGAHAALPTDSGFAVAGAARGVDGNFTSAQGVAVRSSFNHPGMFGGDWYGSHPGAWQAAGWTAARPWNAATWPAVGTALGWGAGVQPIAYNYGTDITYQGDQVYSGDQPVASADDYYQQSANLAQAAPPADPQADDWTSLGTFGLVHRAESDPHYVMQLEINKAGTVAGNYCDMLTDHNLPVHGAVDPKTQKLAWTVGDNKHVVGEVGIYNLTQGEAPALIHVGKDKTQQWLLVRLNQAAPASADGK